jgi:hypothetical protein
MAAQHLQRVRRVHLTYGALVQGVVAHAALTGREI